MRDYVNILSNPGIQNLLNKVLGAGESGSLRRHLAWGSAGSFGLKILATGLTFVTSVLLARILGAKGYGVYAFAIAWVQLLIIFGIFGLDRLLIRNVAVYRAQEKWELLRGILRWSRLVAGVVSVMLALVVAGVWLLWSDASPQETQTFLLAMLLIPLMVFIRLNQSALQGFQHIVTGQIPEMFVRTLLFFLVAAGIYISFRDRVTPAGVMGFYVFVTFLAFIVSLWLLFKRTPQVVRSAKQVYQQKQWLYGAIPLLVVGGVRIINVKIDTIMLGMFRGTELVGIYTAANRAPEIITFILVAVNTALAPAVAILYANGNVKRLQRIITRSARIILFISLPITLLLVAFSKQFLSLFGPEFIQGQTALILLCFARLFSAGMGSVGVLLVNTGHERDVAFGVGVGVILNGILNVLLIPDWGLEGAAIASASSMFIWNSMLVVFAYKRLKIHSTALGKLSIRRSIRWRA